MPSIESRVSLIYNGLVSRAEDEDDALCRWVDVVATTPAELLGFRNKGRLLPGYDADIVIFDPDERHTITTQTLSETAGWSPYDGIDLRGRPIVTISRGEVIADHGQWLGEAGRGRYVVR